MVRIVAGAVLAMGLTGLVAGCGAEASSEKFAAGESAMAAAVVSLDEVPAGFKLADNQRVLEGMEPVDPDCARLFGLADVPVPRDLHGIKDAPDAHAAFYRVSPVASLAEHLFRLPSGRAARHVTEARRAVVKCPRIEVEAGEGDIRLRREDHRRVKALRDALAVRYINVRERVALDVVMAAVDDDLLVVAAPGSFGGPAGARTTEQFAIKALAKLRAVHAGKVR
ncbi:hypothetical protein ACGFNU_10915 [Spirillospora sp. NPDC048911]|uniref:hypothetical protein n=1 Tax=Spirillospora sp. NPDC048911 TaxID=3364527 RepID=UPI0037201A58